VALFKRGNVYWSYIWVDGVRHAKSTGTANRRTAERIDQRFKEELNLARMGVVEPKPEMTFSELAARFLADGSPRPYHIDRLKLLLPYWGKTEIGRITKAGAREYRAHRHHTKKNLSDTTINRDLEALRHMLFWAVDEGILLANPLSRVLMVRERRKPRLMLTVTEEDQLLATAAPHLRSIIIAALDSGMRRGELLTERWEHVDFTRRILYAGISAIVSLIFLAEIRGDLLAQQVTSTPSAVIDNSEVPPPPPTENIFYDRTLGLLRLVMAFLAFAIEIGAGIALHEASQLSSISGEDALALRRELAVVRDRMIAHGHELWALENAGAAFELSFWRDFHRALLNGVKRGAIQKLLLITLSLGVFAHGEKQVKDPVNLVVLLDLSKSTAVKGHGEHAEFEKNVAGITKILAALPAGAKVTVIGITDDSFATPYIILSGELTNDEGYFKERVAKGRLALTRAWQARSAQLAPHCAQTDILGALFVASEVFHESSGGRRKIVVVFSDMKQATRALNVERQPMAQTPAALQQVANNKLFADLRGVDVYAEGVDAAGESVAYWQSLHDFWEAYFAQAGATLARYSALRDLPEFERFGPTTADGRGR
jgi:integrase